MVNEMPNISTEEQQFEVVRGIIDLHRGRVAKAVNEEALLIYWHVGCYISHKLKTNEWGAQVVTKLAEYLAVKDPTLKGYRRRNLYNMVLFYEAYSSPEFQALLQRIGQTEVIALPTERQKVLSTIVQNDSAQIENTIMQIVQNDSAQMPQILSLTIISNHLEILSRKKNPEERLFYILYTYRERLKYKELCRCIDRDVKTSKREPFDRNPSMQRSRLLSSRIRTKPFNESNNDSRIQKTPYSQGSPANTDGRICQNRVKKVNKTYYIPI